MFLLHFIGNQDFRGVILSFRHVQEYHVYKLCRNELILFDCNCDHELKIDVAPVCRPYIIDKRWTCGLWIAVAIKFLLPLLSLPWITWSSCVLCLFAVKWSASWIVFVNVTYQRFAMIVYMWFVMLPLTVCKYNVITVCYRKWCNRCAFEMASWCNASEIIFRIFL